MVWRVVAGLCLAEGCNSREIWTDSISLSIYQFSGSRALRLGTEAMSFDEHMELVDSMTTLYNVPPNVFLDSARPSKAISGLALIT